MIYFNKDTGSVNKRILCLPDVNDPDIRQPVLARPVVVWKKAPVPPVEKLIVVETAEIK